MLNLLDNIDPLVLTGTARQLPLPDDFALTRDVVPEKVVNNVKYRVSNRSRTRYTAKYRAYDAEPRWGRRQVEHSVMEGYLPPIGQRLLVGELETILLDLARGADDQQLVDQLYDDVQNHVYAIRARLEAAAGDLLLDGKFTLADENGLTLEADYTVPAGHFPTAATLWSDAANARPLTDEQAWRQLLVDEGFPAHGELLMSSSVYATYANSGEYRAAFYGFATAAANVPSRGLNPAEVNTVRQTYQLPPIRIYDTQVNIDGVETRVLPANRVILLPADKRALAETQYGITAEALALTRGTNPRITLQDAPGLVVTVKEFDTPVRVVTTGSAVAMPVLYNDGFVTARVLA